MNGEDLEFFLAHREFWLDSDGRVRWVPSGRIVSETEPWGTVEQHILLDLPKKEKGNCEACGHDLLYQYQVVHPSRGKHHVGSECILLLAKFQNFHFKAVKELVARTQRRRKPKHVSSGISDAQQRAEWGHYA